MSTAPVFRPATDDDAPALAARIREVSPEVVDSLLQGLLPGISVENILTMVLRDASSHFSHKNCVLAELDGAMAGLLFAYPAEHQGIPVLMERMVSARRLLPVRELLTLCAPGSLYINTLWVDARVRGQGMADALMDYARFWAGQMGRAALSLFAWRDNTRAVAFYRRQGFSPVREITAQGPLAERHSKGDLYILPLGNTP
ncbi:GNAT family N-acetyltransferase [uncultured Desulfovibrio sp.]|jgi:ribosomal protein S18 acetylase RimI-like enzyme|uniref:GNAT family N-acetyltransferase n=1 Tax=uncultured Desulfovibrio sp. TaxID=167968 RepID=UPI0026146124|nr:GNAT family N-acetyltransferase [uncultured Desulfovibrio sp.]